MTTLGLNEQHDLYLNAAGDLVIKSDLDACIQNCKTAMLAQRGEMIYAMDEGIPYRSTLWDQYRPAQFEAAARSALLRVDGVLRINKFTIERSGNDFIYRAEIMTVWGIGTVTNGRII